MSGKGGSAGTPPFVLASEMLLLCDLLRGQVGVATGTISHLAVERTHVFLGELSLQWDRELMVCLAPHGFNESSHP